ADLDADADAETIASLVEATEALETGLDEAEEWDDLQTNEQLMAEGFYDVLGHYKDYPVEWAALKEHEQQGNVDQILRALDALGSEFMERHCMEALIRMGDAEAFEEMHARAQKRDKPGIEALGKMGPDATEAVDTLIEYVDTDSDPQLQKVTFRALGEIGSEEATQPLANKLEMDDDNVRPLAARALGLIGDTRAIDPLADTIAEDEDRTVRTAAAWALRQIGTREALEAAAEYDDAKAYTLQAEAKKAREALDAAAVEA
ncbi:HEAT repeat domain-containing protein, partial [Halolamina litorea]